MIGSAVAKYREIQQQTSTPGELLLALYDGLFRFLAGAQHSFASGHRPKGSELVSKSHAIISELLLALDYSQSPELCEKLASVYDFCLSRLTEANMKGDPQKVAEVIRVLTPLREAWRVAVPKAAIEAAQGKR
ncbi:MAG TPA: flagellar export chaperone FliS [Polyangiaceae bacterium]|jgi:flagellar protein FliS|nr:flagellar export chaperone FliS [Polyangiaceae bacterium]